MKNHIATLYTLAGAFLLTVPARADDITDLKARVAALKLVVSQNKTDLDQVNAGTKKVTDKLQFVAVEGKNMVMRGCNVYIQQGSVPMTANGLGNLTVGMNPARMDNTDVRTGSHFLVLGTRNNYAGNSGLISGDYNSASGMSVILTGNHNTATGMESAILTGGINFTQGTYGLVGTGVRNSEAPSAPGGTILTGTDNLVKGFYGSIVTGSQCLVSSKFGAVLTGMQSRIYSGDYASILTGEYNAIESSGRYNAIVTGYANCIRMDNVGVALLTGKSFLVNHDALNKPYIYRAMTEGVALRP